MSFTNELTGASGSYTVGGSTINYTATATGGDLATFAAGYGGIDGTNYYIGNDVEETYTYAFDQTIAGLQINVNALGAIETLDFIINGVDVDLNTLIANGDVTVISTDNGTVDGNGDLIGNSTESDGTKITSLQFNIPIDSIALALTGLSGGALVEIIASDQPAPDGTVEGTTGDDLIDASYAGDPEGEQVDNNDAVGTGGNEDVIVGGAGNDTIFAGAGNDSVEGGSGHDSISGGDASATILNGDFAAGAANWTGGASGIETNAEGVYLGNGSTNRVAEIDVGPNEISTLEQGFVVTEPGTATLSFDGALRTSGELGVDGYEVEILDSAGTVVGSMTVIPTSQTTWETYTLDVAFPDADTYTLRFTEIGGNNGAGALLDNVAFITATDDDTLLGGSGNDTIYGNGGDDSLSGGGGTDSVFGGTGDDYVDGGFGTDVLNGGDGNDTVSYLDSFGNPTAESLNLDLEAGTALLNGVGNEIATNFENAISGDTADTITGTAGANEISSGGGNDSIDGGGGRDTLLGGAGDDTLYGGLESDTLEGGDGADLVDGGDWDDVLSGGLGDDTILANFGTDTMDGGDGIDTYDVAGSEAAHIRYDVNLETGFDQFNNQYSNIENVIGGDQGDSITGDDVDNLLDGDGGNDTIDGGAGDDTVIGGVGNDALAGGAGSDVLTGGAGDDSLVGDDGDAFTIIYDEDFSSGAAGWSNPTTENDAGFGDILGRFAGSDGTIATQRTFDIDMSANEVVIEFDALLIDSWNSEDFIITVNGEEVRLAHLEGDTFDPASQSFTDADGATYTFDFTNTSTGALGGSVGTDDTVMGVVLTIGNPPSSVTIGFGANLNSTLDNESFAIDNFSIVAFEDSNDTLTGGVGDDVLTGGAGDDNFVFNAGDGNDTITDFNADNTGSIDDGDQTNNDFIDLSQFYSGIGKLRNDLEDDGILNQSSGVSTGSTDLGGTIVLTGITAADLTFDNTNVACFTAGSMIETQEGPVRVEDLVDGSMLRTLDSGWQPVRVILSKTVVATTGFAPVVISKGALGNDEELVVSPAHRMLISDWRAELLFGEDEVLVSAKALCNGDTIYRRPMPEVTYFHILLDQHEIIYAAGVPTESYHLSSDADVMDDGVKGELEKLFPHLLACASDSVRPTLRGFEAQALQALAA